MYQAGLITTINTDNTSVSGLSLTDELVRAVEKIGLSVDDVKQHTLNSAAPLPILGQSGRLVSRLTAELYPTSNHAIDINLTVQAIDVDPFAAP
jgi:hypothetical protein